MLAIKQTLGIDVAKNRITDLASDQNTNFEVEENKTSIKWGVVVSLGLVIAALVGSLVYVFFFSKKKLFDVQETNSKALTEDSNALPGKLPVDIPTDPKLNQARTYYKQGLFKPAKNLLHDIVSSTKPEKIRAFANFYLGLIAMIENEAWRAKDYFESAINLDTNNAYFHYHLARAFRSLNRMKEAKLAALKAASLDPKFQEASILKGQIEIDEQNYSAAEKTLSLLENTAEKNYNMGRVYREKGEVAEAKASFKRALDLAGTGEIAHNAANQLALLYAKDRSAGRLELENAKTYARKAVQIAPVNPKYLYNLALIEYRLGNSKMAIHYLNEASKYGASSPKIKVYVSRLYSELGEREKAITTLETARQNDPYNYLIMSQLADLYLADQRYDMAKQLLEDIIEKSSVLETKASAHKNLGIVYQNLKDNDRAIYHFEKSINLNMKDESTMIELGKVYEANNETAKGIKKFKQAILMNPNLIKVKLSLSKLLLRNGDYNQAEHYLKQVMRHRRSDVKLVKAEGFYLLGRIYKARGTYNAAIEYFSKASKIPNISLAQKSLIEVADCHIRNGDDSNAAQLALQKALALRESTEARLILARALLQKGTVSGQDRAEEELTTIIKFGKDPVLVSRALTLRGNIFYQRGLFEKSLSDFNRALEFDPGNERAIKNKQATLTRLGN